MKKVKELFKVNNYDDNYLGSASIATATTYSDNSVYAELGTRRRHRQDRRHGPEARDPDARSPTTRR